MLTLPKDPFHDCYGPIGGIGITHIYLEEGITTIPEQFCFALRELEYINIPSSVTKINQWMFYSVKYETFGIRKIVIPKTVEQITSSLITFDSDNVPEEPLKILYEKESKTSGYSSFNDYCAYYYSIKEPSTTGKFWHYVNNEPTIW